MIRAGRGDRTTQSINTIKFNWLTAYRESAPGKRNGALLITAVTFRSIPWQSEDSGKEGFPYGG